MTPLVARWANRTRRRIITRRIETSPPIPHRRLARTWRPVKRPARGPHGSALVRYPWNGLRAVAARTWPRRWTGRRHHTSYRVARLIWMAWAVALLLVALALAGVALVVWPLWQLAADIGAAVLVVAGWSPPTVFDPTAVDPERALFGDDTERSRQRQRANQVPPTSGPAPPPPEPPSLEERQVAAAEAHALALNRMALAEATRPATAPVAAPMVTHWSAPRRGVLHSKVKRLAIAFGVAYLVLITLAGGANTGPTPAEKTNAYLQGDTNP